MKTGDFARVVIPHLKKLAQTNEAAMDRIARRLVADVKRRKALFVYGSGHSALFAMEFYHRAGGPSFVIPVSSEFLLPLAGPGLARALERVPTIAAPLLDLAGPRRGEMIWIASQSGINGSSVEMALEARRRGLRTVAFTSLVHSRSSKSRHASGKRLFEVCDEVVDLGGHVGDAAMPLGRGGVRAGPLSTLGAVLLGHSILVAACAELERAGVHCVYASVNTPNGEKRNRAIEKRAAVRDPRLR